MSVSETEEDVEEFSYEVLDWLSKSMLTVAENPKNMGEFLYNYTERLPTILDAVMPLVKEEHRGIIGEVIKNSGKMNGRFLLYLTKK